jgi:hypothetical protein
MVVNLQHSIPEEEQVPDDRQHFVIGGKKEIVFSPAALLLSASLRRTLQGSVLYSALAKCLLIM